MLGFDYAGIQGVVNYISITNRRLPLPLCDMDSYIWEIDIRYNRILLSHACPLSLSLPNCALSMARLSLWIWCRWRSGKVLLIKVGVRNAECRPIIFIICYLVILLSAPHKEEWSSWLK